MKQKFDFFFLADLQDTRCEFFKLIDDKNVVDDLHYNVLEKDTRIVELEMIQKFNEDKIRELELKKGSLEVEVKELKTEMWQLKMDVMKSTTNLKHMCFGFFVAFVMFVIFYCLK